MARSQGVSVLRRKCMTVAALEETYVERRREVLALDTVSGGCCLLCGCSKLVNIAVPETIDVRAINIKSRLNAWERNENITLCINSARAIGCQVASIGTQEVAEGRVSL